jgi:hypothetical protein
MKASKDLQFQLNQLKISGTMHLNHILKEELNQIHQRYSEYTTIITRIRQNCFVQNFKGASVGLFNPNLIARKLGLKEQTDNTNVNIEVPLFPDVSTDDSDK